MEFLFIIIFPTIDIPSCMNWSTRCKYTIIELVRVREVYNWLQYFAPEDLEREVAGAGFYFKGLYSDVAGNPNDPKSSEFAIIAKKV